MDLLSIRNLSTHFFTSMGIIRAVDGINLEIKEKECIGLVGESGSGKSVTALSVMRLVPHPGKTIEGEVLYRGKDLLKLNSDEMCSIRGKEIAMVFQDPMTYLNPVVKVGDQVEEAIRMHQEIEKTKTQEKTVEALRMVRIPSPSEFAKYYPHQLSGGMRQRVLMAMALSCNPSLLIADEPTTAVDVTIQAQLLDLLQELKNELGLSVMLITHDLGIVAELTDRVYIMYAGKIVESADVFSIFDDPLHPYTSGLLKSVVSIDEFKKELESIDGMVPDMANLPSGCRFHPRCSYAQKICVKSAPDTVVAGPNHYVSCWLHR